MLETDSQERNQRKAHTHLACWTGTWFVGVYRSDSYGECSFITTLNTFGCPMDCNGRGTCQRSPTNSTRTCACNSVSPVPAPQTACAHARAPVALQTQHVQPGLCNKTRCKTRKPKHKTQVQRNL